MTPYEFLHPFALFENGRMTGIGFRRRNHPIPCTTRRMKTMRKQLSRFRVRYGTWIARNVGDDAFGNCQEYAERMVAAFPELRLVAGHYYDAIWGERGHWWCETREGEIVDPTAKQFPTRGNGKYVEWDGDVSKLPSGVCMNCGDPVYRGAYCCSDRCERIVAADLEIRR